jgi:hypothetical protein
MLLSLLLQCGPSIKAYPWPAEELLRCTTGNTGLAGGEVDRPSVLKHPLFPLALLVFIVVGESPQRLLWTAESCRDVLQYFHA